MGEGGALLIRDPEDIERAEIVREKGTNRSKFFRGQIDKYTWMDAGSSYLPSELNAAYLWAQLEKAQEIYDDRMKTWNRYYEALKELEEAGKIEMPVIPEDCVHNAHMFVPFEREWYYFRIPLYSTAYSSGRYEIRRIPWGR